MANIEFKINQFRTFETKVEGVSLGFTGPDSGGYIPALGELLQYDGVTVILKDGREFHDVPQLRSAISAGWFAAVGEEVSYRPKSANIQVRPTETRGFDSNRSTLKTEMAEDTEVGSVSARKTTREATNLDAARKVPLQTAAAQRALGVRTTGDLEVDGFLNELEQDVTSVFGLVVPKRTQVVVEADNDETIVATLNLVENPTSTRKSARFLPLENRDENKTFPLVRENTEEEVGSVVGSVSNQKRTIERSKEYEMNVAPARPPTTEQGSTPRIGGAGVLVVDEERDMGRIVLSGKSAPSRIENSAKAESSRIEGIRMGVAQVGNKSTAEPPPSGVTDGVTVGRVLSPARTSFIATDANTSSTAIQRTEQGQPLKVEGFAKKATQAVATGDVQEARSGDSLEDLLPEAVKAPTVYKRPEEDPAYAAVKMLIPNFNWNRDLPIKAKVAEALKHIENPQYVKGILAVESEITRDMIKKAIAEEISKRKKKAKNAKKPSK